MFSWSKAFYVSFFLLSSFLIKIFTLSLPFSLPSYLSQLFPVAFPPFSPSLSSLHLPFPSSPKAWFYSPLGGGGKAILYTPEKQNNLCACCVRFIRCFCRTGWCSSERLYSSWCRYNVCYITWFWELRWILGVDVVVVVVGGCWCSWCSSSSRWVLVAGVTKDGGWLICSAGVGEEVKGVLLWLLCFWKKVNNEFNIPTFVEVNLQMKKNE